MAIALRGRALRDLIRWNGRWTYGLGWLRMLAQNSLESIQE
jgi:hypothetical protein